MNDWNWTLIAAIALAVLIVGISVREPNGSDDPGEK